MYTYDLSHQLQKLYSYQIFLFDALMIIIDHVWTFILEYMDACAMIFL